MTPFIKQAVHDRTTLTLPLPLYLVVEDVGWWQGQDGSRIQEPFRNRMDRDHCLADYEALAWLARKLGMKIGLAMVLAEWDRTGFLKNVPGATWKGRAWRPDTRRLPKMEAAADFLNRHSDLFDLALHGVGHEFWDKGRMERTEFHDAQGRMRPARVVAAHLEAFWTLMEDNGIQARPGLFIPPALNHSFGNHTIQPLLKKFCINYVATRFSRARQYRQPRHPLITWESGVVILERGTSPVAWDHVGAVPVPPGCQPLLPLHWANLLHPCPEKNLEVVRPWADLVLDLSHGPERVLARDAADCWQQSAVCYMADLNTCAQGFLISLDQMPGIACLTGEFCVHLQGGGTQKWTCDNARITEVFEQPGKFQRLRLLPAPNSRSICLRPVAAPER